MGTALLNRDRYGQGKPMPKDASGAGTNWGTGIQSDDPAGVLNPLNSRLDFDGTVQPTDLDRATDAREKGRIGIFGSALSYAGSSPRITSEPIGRDINPLGRGSGIALVGGELNLGRIAPALPMSKAAGGTGSSVNNQYGDRADTMPPSKPPCGWPEPEPKPPYSPPRPPEWPSPPPPDFPPIEEAPNTSAPCKVCLMAKTTSQMTWSHACKSIQLVCVVRVRNFCLLWKPTIVSVNCDRDLKITVTRHTGKTFSADRWRECEDWCIEQQKQQTISGPELFCIIDGARYISQVERHRCTNKWATATAHCKSTKCLRQCNEYTQASGINYCAV